MKERIKATGRKHFTWEERNLMQTVIRATWPYKKKVCWVKLAELMNRPWRSVQREYLQGTVTQQMSSLERYETYSSEKGQQRAEEAHRNKGTRMKFNTTVAAALEHLIIEGHCSPYVAVERLRKEGQFTWLPCERTVYYAIDKQLLRIQREHLPYRRPPKKTTQRGRRMAYLRTPGRSISERPVEAETREVYGHWEMDTLVGPTHGSGVSLLVLTERTTRQEIIRKMPDRTQKSVHRALRHIARREDTPFPLMKSLTSDNGSEFWDFRSIASLLHKAGAPKTTQLFYAHAYSAFERGSNENANRHIRRDIPKGTDLARYSHKHIQQIEDKINAMERKILNGKSAQEKTNELTQNTAT